MRKLLNHLQPKRKDGTEEQPILIGSTEPSHLNANDRPFILNRPLSSSLKPSFSCLLEFEPRDHLDGGEKKPLPQHVLLCLTTRGRSHIRHRWLPATCLSAATFHGCSTFADLPRRDGTGSSWHVKISVKTRCSFEGWNKVTTEEPDVPWDFPGSLQKISGYRGGNGN